MKEISITVSDDGSISIETKGFTGKACMKESQFIKDLLGRELSQQLTPAYYQGKQKIIRYIQLCG